jgi:hypothetical protein
MMGPAQQHQVAQVGRAPVQPVAQMMGLAPLLGPVTPREDTATVADGQGGALRGRDDPVGAAELHRLGRGTAKGHRQQPLVADVVDHPVSHQELGQLRQTPRRERQVVIHRAGQRDLLDRLSLTQRER